MVVVSTFNFYNANFGLRSSSWTDIIYFINKSSKIFFNLIRKSKFVSPRIPYTLIKYLAGVSLPSQNNNKKRENGTN